jgi:hypothetical protein
LQTAGKYYLPPADYAVKTPLVIDGWSDGLIVGAGRLSGTTLNFATGANLKLRNCKRITFCNITFFAPNPAGGVVEILGDQPCEVRFLNCTFGSRNVLGPNQTSAPGMIIRAPGKVTCQECHFFHSDPGILLDHPDADLRVLGGNFQCTSSHIVQKAGAFELYAIGFQLAYSNTDVLITTPAKKPFVIAAVRTEGPGTLVATADTPQKIDLLVKGCSIATAKMPFVRYRAGGTAVLYGNHADNGVEVGNGQLWSVGNYLGGAHLTADPYALGPQAKAVCAGDLWGFMKPGDAYKEPCGGPITPASMAANNHPVPLGLTFLETGMPFVTVQSPPTPIWLPMPVISNIADLLPSVKKWGAVGDGKADDTAAVQKALDDCRLGQLYFPAGTYRVTKPLFINQRKGGWIAGAGREQTVIINTAGGGVVYTDGCGYTTIQDITFALPEGSKDIAFNLGWTMKAPTLPNYSGAALQANAFYRCGFVNGAYGLSIGTDGYMGSESLIAECDFVNCGSGLATRCYNALTNNAVGCRFINNGVCLDQASAGSFNAFDCSFEGSTGLDLRARNSAADAFYVANCISTARKSVYATGHTGAVINLLFDGFRYAGASPAAFGGYAAGGSVIFLNSDIGAGKLGGGGGIAGSSMLLIGTTYTTDQPIVTGGRSVKYVLPYVK